jgi:hypothetical protein
MSRDSGSGIIVEMPEAPIVERRAEGLAGQWALAISAFLMVAGITVIVRDVADTAHSGRSAITLTLVLSGPRCSPSASPGPGDSLQLLAVRQ